MSQQPPKRLPLIIQPENRDTTSDKDAKLLNGFVEKTKGGEFWVYKRCGLTLADDVTGGATTPRGVYNWLDDIYSIFNTTLYKNGSSVGTVSGAGFYTFRPCLGTTPKLFFQNGTKGYVYDSGGGLVEVTDGDYPATTTVPGVAYLDGTTYVMTGAAFIQGSEINDPTDWDPLNSILAQIEPDRGVALAQQLYSVIAFKGWSTEVFYDAANATGSPLGRVEGAKVNFGCRSAFSVQDISGVLVWVSQNRSGSVGVMKMEGLKASSIATPAIERRLQEADFTTVRSWGMHLSGHTFYGLTLTAENLTLVYDLGEGLWYEWTDTSGNYFPVVASTFDSSQRVVLQHATDGCLYYADDLVYTDDGDLFTVDIYTPNFDAGSRLRKYCNILEVVADRVAGNSLSLYRSDDDYATWSSARTLNLANERPMVEGEGTFKVRAYRFSHRLDKPLRIKAVDMHLDLGLL